MTALWTSYAHNVQLLLDTCQVTLYPESATVVRDITLDSFTPGLNDYTLTHLSPHIDPATLRASIPGTNAAIVDSRVECNVDYEPDYLKDQTSMDIARLCAQLEKAHLSVEHAKGKKETVTRQMAMLDRMAETRCTLHEGSITSDGLEDYAARRNKLVDELLVGENVYQESHGAWKALDELVRDHRSKQEPLYTNARFTIDAIEHERNPRLLLSYVVRGATWEPRYKLRVDTVARTAELTFLAEMVNTSGEDWRNASIQLARVHVSSLGQRAPGTRMPPLGFEAAPSAPDESSRASSSALSRQSSTPSSPALSTPTSSAWDAASTASSTIDWEALTPRTASPTACPSPRPFDKASQQQQQRLPPAALVTRGIARIVSLQGARTLPSTAKPTPRTTSHTTCRLVDVRLEYSCVPSVSSSVYLELDGILPSNAPGGVKAGAEVGVTLDGTYLGCLTLDEEAAPGKHFSIGLGVEERLAVRVELERRNFKVRTLDDPRRHIFVQKIWAITSRMDVNVLLMVRQPLPWGLTNKEVSIKGESIDHNVDFDKIPPEELGWLVLTSPGETVRKGVSYEHAE